MENRMSNPDARKCIHRLAWSPDGLILAVSAYDPLSGIENDNNRVVLIYVENGSVETALNLGDEWMISDVGWNSSGTNLFISQIDGAIHNYDIAKQSLQLAAHHPTHKRFTVHDSISVHPINSLIASGDNMGQIYIFDPHTGEIVASLELGQDDRSHPYSIQYLTWSPQGNHLAVQTQSKMVRVYEWDSEARVFGNSYSTFDNWTVNDLPAMAWSYDGHKLALYAASQQDNTSLRNTLVWNYENQQFGKMIAPAVPSSRESWSLCESIFTGFDREGVGVWNTNTGEVLKRISEGHNLVDFWTAALSSTGKLAIGANRDVGLGTPPAPNTADLVDLYDLSEIVRANCPQSSRSMAYRDCYRF